ncbi:MAG: hypothetical protein ACIAQU_04285 [Phycisphaerales bacterium JB064]
MATTKKAEAISIPRPNIQQVTFGVVGLAPYVQNKFSEKARNEMREKMEAGPSAKKGKKRDAKDFKQCYEQAIHYSKEGWIGIPAPAFRNAMISACRLVNFTMTRAKLSVFVEPDGFDRDDGTPLVRITKGEPRYVEHMVRNATGVADIRPRPMWDAGWEASVTVRFDGDQFTPIDVANLLSRAGQQVGIGEGRPDSKASTGQGWGLFLLQEGEGDE